MCVCVLYIYKDGNRYLVYVCIYGGKEYSYFLVHLLNVSQPHLLFTQPSRTRTLHRPDVDNVGAYQHISKTHTHCPLYPHTQGALPRCVQHN